MRGPWTARCRSAGRRTPPRPVPSRGRAHRSRRVWSPCAPRRVAGPGHQAAVLAQRRRRAADPEARELPDHALLGDEDLDDDARPQAVLDLLDAPPAPAALAGGADLLAERAAAPAAAHLDPRAGRELEHLERLDDRPAAHQPAPQ